MGSVEKILIMSAVLCCVLFLGAIIAQASLPCKITNSCPPKRVEKQMSSSNDTTNATAIITNTTTAPTTTTTAPTTTTTTKTTTTRRAITRATTTTTTRTTTRKAATVAIETLGWTTRMCQIEYDAKVADCVKYKIVADCAAEYGFKFTECYMANPEMQPIWKCEKTALEKRSACIRSHVQHLLSRERALYFDWALKHEEGSIPLRWQWSHELLKEDGACFDETCTCSERICTRHNQGRAPCYRYHGPDCEWPCSENNCSVITIEFDDNCPAYDCVPIKYHLGAGAWTAIVVVVLIAIGAASFIGCRVCRRWDYRSLPEGNWVVQFYRRHRPRQRVVHPVVPDNEDGVNIEL